jgi:hypothetical protein
MDKLINQLLDSPKMVSDKLPWNNWNSCIEESEDSIAGWIGKLFNIGAFAFLVMAISTILSPFWTGGFVGGFDGNDFVETLGMLLGMVLWVYAAFPISQIIRNVGSNLSDSKSNIINFIFHEVPIALIKTAGYILAMVGLFSAIAGLIGFVTTLDLGGFVSTDGLLVAANIGVTALVALISVFAELPGVATILVDTLAEVSMMPEFGEAWTMVGAESVFGAFVAVLFTLVNLYINVVIFKFVYGLLSTLVNWVKSPYLPFKSL